MDPMIEDISPSPWHPSGIQITLDFPLTVHLTWSPCADQLAVVIWKLGVFVLDLATMQLETVRELRPLWRATWEESGEGLLITASSQGQLLMRRTAPNWGIEATKPSRGWIFLTEWGADGSYAGVLIDFSNNSTCLVELNDQLEIIRTVTPKAWSGNELTVPLVSNPTWWTPGKSILVIAESHGEQEPYVIDLESGGARPLGSRKDDIRKSFRSFSRAARAPIIAGLQYPEDDVLHKGPAELWTYHQRTEKLHRLGLIRHSGAFGGTVALSSNGDRVAFIDDEMRIQILPTDVTLTPVAGI